MNLSRALLGASLAVTVAIGFTGCAVETPEGAGDVPDAIPTDAPLPEVSIDDYAHVSARLDFGHAAVSLPLDRYHSGSPAFVMTVLHAIAVRTDECMVGEGFPSIAAESDWSAYPEESRTYGLWSVDYALKYGVELAEEGRPPEGPVDLDRAYGEAYPACRDEAKQSLSASLGVLDAQAMTGLDVRIRGSASSLARGSRDGLAALADWQGCMEERGVILDSDGRPSEEYKAQGRDAVVGAIVVEAECAATTGAIQRLYDLQARYEAAYIDAMADELTDFARQRNAIRSDLEAAIAGE